MSLFFSAMTRERRKHGYIPTSCRNAENRKIRINLLSNKRILAKLLKEEVPEVQKYSLKEIESFISDEKIQKVGVHPVTKLLDKA